MRILLYNWVEFDNIGNRGGGVTVYLHDMIDYVLKTRDDIEIVFLSSGSYYDLFDAHIRYEKVDNIFGERCRSYIVINSSVVAPAYLSFDKLSDVLYDEKMLGVIEEFINTEGPFDVFHFNNLEGIPLKILSLKNNYPKMQFIYTLHNYYPFCPQVNLWKNDSCNCEENNTGEECIKCIRQIVPIEKLRLKMSMKYHLLGHTEERLINAYKECGKKIDSYYFQNANNLLTDSKKKLLTECLNIYRTSYVENINKYVDVVLAVSNSVRMIAEKMGVESKKMIVSYIGTKYADVNYPIKKIQNKDNISLIYMGYQRMDKGFFFLIDVLNKMEICYTSKINLTIAAKKLPEYPDVKIDESKFNSVIWMNGYDREKIGELLKKQDLGIVPSLWEDNLPQVAIEMVAHKVPIVTSNLGGAKELGGDSKFCFEAGNIDECIRKLTYFIDNPEEICSYWNEFGGLTTMEKHIKMLFEIYKVNKL